MVLYCGRVYSTAPNPFLLWGRGGGWGVGDWTSNQGFKKGNLTGPQLLERVFVDLRELGLARKRVGGCFWGGIDTPMHTMHTQCFMFTYTLLTFFSCFPLTKMFFSLFHFFFCDEISNICNRILTNQKPE